MSTERIFYAGNYYLVTNDNTVIASSKNMKDVKEIAQPTDTILVALTYTGSNKYDPSVDKIIQHVDKIVIDFNKKVLTVYGESANLFGIEFKKGDNKMSNDDLQDWEDILSDARIVANELEVIGNPPIDGKDITDEMSDL